MEIEALSNSTSSLFWDCLRTRFPAWLVLVLPLLMVAPAIVGGRVINGLDAAIAFGMAVLLFVELRLWDDLCDREQDCRERPLRVLCRVASLRPFIGLLVVLMLANLVAVALRLPWQASAWLLGLHGHLATWYTVRATVKAGPVANYHAVLLKYPICGLLLALNSQAATLQLYASAAVVYLVLCIAEVLHDGRLRARRSAWICLWIELTLLCMVLAWLAGVLLSSSEGNR